MKTSITIHVTYLGVHYLLQANFNGTFQVSFLHPEFAHINEETLVDKYFESADSAKEWMRNKIEYILDSMSF